MKKPVHVAIIMDGNGRWAKEKGLATIEGHKKGVETVKMVIEVAIEIGIPYLTLYAFSTENWLRPKEEVEGLFNLLREFLQENKKKLQEKDVRIIVIGEREGLPQDIVEQIEEIMEFTKENKKLTLIIAFNYGSRKEIVNAVKRICKDVVQNKVKIEEINEELFERYLYTHNIPDPDLFIRTSGEYRLSNFLLWQLSYTELWFTKTYWPDFKKEDFITAVDDFSRRKRRFGGRIDV